ncbi:MAG: glycoside hydrolase family 127 protein [Kiritimatiellae bacterium]|nr:glycoside hydrolase family 127 protein [Kiritimatiellia bacterium]
MGTKKLYWVAVAAMSLTAFSGTYDRAAADAKRDAIEAEVKLAEARVDEAQAKLKKTASLTEYAALAQDKDGRKIWSAAIAKALAENEIVKIPASEEPYWLDRTVMVPSNRRIEADAGAEIAAAPGFMEALLKNSAWKDGVKSPKKGPRNDNIAVAGGIWNMMADKRIVEHDAAMMFSNVKGLTIRDLTIERGREFAIQISDAEDVTCERIEFVSCFADGVHVNGPVKHIAVRKLSGTVGDDFVALNAFDWPGCSHDFGPISYALVEDISLKTGNKTPETDLVKSMRLLPGWHKYEDGREVECTIENVIVRRFNGLRNFKVYFQSFPYKLAEGPDPYHYARRKPGRENNLFFEDLAVDLDHPPDMLAPCREGDPERGHSACWELGADIGNIYIRNVDVFAGLDRYPHLKVAMIGPKTYGLPGREAGDPYMDITVGKLVLDDVRIHGGQMDTPIVVYSFHDINHDGKSSGKGRLDELVVVGGGCVPGADSIKLKGCVGEKAEKLFEKRLNCAKARGDIFEETVTAFRTRHDDLHEDPSGHGATSGYGQGAYWGKTMLSHCAHARLTGSKEDIKFIHAQALRLIGNYQHADGYLATYDDPDFIKGWSRNIWGRKYTLWALVEAYDLTNDKMLLAAAVKMCEHLDAQLERTGCSIAETGCFGGIPSMSILKPVIMTYLRTGNRTCMKLAKAIIAENDRADGRCPNLIANAFTGKPVSEWYAKPWEWAKAYEFMSVVEGLVMYARVTKDKRLLEAAIRIFDKLAEHEMNAVESVGFHDTFIGAARYPNSISESCGVIHWMRLCKYLHMATGELKYLDYWEKTFLNAFLAGIFRDGEWGTHDVRSHGHRHLQGINEVNMTSHFCCIDNAPRAFGDWSDCCVGEKSPIELDLNFYTDGEYAVKGVKLEVSGNYPVSDTVQVKLTTPRKVKVNFRVPGWCKAMTVDGVAAKGPRASVDFAAGGRTVTLGFDMTPRIEKWKGNLLPPDKEFANYLRDNFEMPDHNKEMKGVARKTAGVRVLRGPLVLAKCARVGDDDRTCLDDLGVDETWNVSLKDEPANQTWGQWTVEFTQCGEKKSVQASDFQSAADTDNWRNAFSIWF